jgi:aconitate hydratase
VTIRGVAGLLPRQVVSVEVTYPDGAKRSFEAKVRIDTENELDYFRHGGILHYVLRSLAKGS